MIKVTVQVKRLGLCLVNGMFQKVLWSSRTREKGGESSELGGASSGGGSTCAVRFE